MQPFITANFWILAGLLILLLGASIVAYRTWNVAWWLRYAITPALLAGFTIALAETARWLESRADSLRGTGAVLRGAAVQLLPLNFMVLALLGTDEQVPGNAKLFVVPVVGLGYLSLFGFLLRRWFSGLGAQLARMLAAVLLFMNLLLAFVPLIAGMPAQEMELVLGIVTNLGFVAGAWAMWYFTSRVLTRSMLEERTVPWFTGSMLVATLLQVFGWSHVHLRAVPDPSNYALVMVAAAGLAFFAERRGTRLLERFFPYEPGAFVGFALVAFAVLLGISGSVMRIAVLCAAGLVWIAQARQRPGRLHHWIGLGLLLCAGASLGALSWFPKSESLNGLPVLGLVIAAGFGVIRAVSRRRNWPRLAASAAEFQPLVLMLTAAVAVLSQWHLGSSPMHTAAALAVVAAVLAWRAVRQQRLPWLHTAMAVLALVLPYLGCLAMTGRAGQIQVSLHGNTLVFGLGLLSFSWIALIAWKPLPLFLKARSTVLWMYGGIGMAAMVVRVLLEHGALDEAQFARVLMDCTGPFIMGAALVFAAYYSRSLVPSGMAAVILVVLFPELRGRIEQYFPVVHWGSGLGSALSAMGLMAACFLASRAAFLKNMTEGDLLLGTRPFPFRRTDASLFTIPLIISAFALAIRVDSWTVYRNLAAGTLGWRTVFALAATGVVWNMLAVQLRDQLFGRLSVVLSWIAFYLAFHFGVIRYLGHMDLQASCVGTALLLQVLYFVYRGAARRYPWAGELLARPTRLLLAVASEMGAWVCVGLLLTGQPLAWVQYAAVFVAAQMVWHGIIGRRQSPGTVLFLLLFSVILAVFAPGVPLHRIALQSQPFAQVVYPLLTVLLAIQIVHLICESMPGWQQRLRPLAEPFQGGSFLLAGALAVGCLCQSILIREVWFTSAQMFMMAAVLMLCARANRSGALALAALLLVYVCTHIPALRAAQTPDARLAVLLAPSHSGLFGFVLASLAVVGRIAARMFPRVVQGAFPALPVRIAGSLWLLVPAWMLALQATAYQLLESSMGGTGYTLVQLAAPYLATAVFALTGAHLRRPLAIAVSGVLLTIANTHAVYVIEAWNGHPLLLAGLWHPHLLCLGAVVTLGMLTGVRLASGTSPLSRIMNPGILMLSLLSLLLMSVQYVWSALFIFAAAGTSDMAVGRTPFSALCSAIVMQLIWVFGVLWSRRDDSMGKAIADPARFALNVVNQVMAWACIVFMLTGHAAAPLYYVVAFAAVQLVWHGLSSRWMHYGVALFAMAAALVIAHAAPRVSIEQLFLQDHQYARVFLPLVILTVVIQIIQLVLELRPAVYARLRPMFVPFQAGSLAVALALGIGYLGENLLFQQVWVTPWSALLLAVTLAALARANRSGLSALAAAVIAYVVAHTGEMAQSGSVTGRLQLLFSPWHLALWALLLGSAVALVRKLEQKISGFVAGPYPMWRPVLSQSFYLVVPAWIAAVAAALLHTVVPELRHTPLQLLTPYVACLTFVITGWALRMAVPYAVAMGLLALANVHAVYRMNSALGMALTALGLSDNHLLCIGLFITLLMGTALRRVLRRENSIARIDQSSLLLSGLVLLLLAFNYYAHPNLASIGAGRFAVSGILALAAGLYFRRAARYPSPGEVQSAPACEGIYHFAVAVAIWCFALMLPFLRHPATALIALTMPALFFYVRAEIAYREFGKTLPERTPGAAWRDSASLLSFLLLAFYFCRPVFQMILFPGVPVHTNHFHYNAPVVIALSLLMLRLRGLGGNWWLAFYGGLALAVGAFFCVTALPGLSPFTDIMAAAWVALGLGHLFIAATYQRSIVRTWVALMTHMDGESWATLRRYWGRVLLTALHVVLGLVLLQLQRAPLQVAPLVLMLAGVVLHAGIAGNLKVYYAIAAAEIALALHAGFVIPSLLPKEAVIWVILGLWTALLVARQVWSSRLTSEVMGPAVALVCALAAAHIGWHRPWSIAGLSATAVAAVLGALTPRGSLRPQNAEQRACAALLLMAVPWLVYFSQIGQGGRDIKLEAFVQSWPILVTVTVAFAVTFAARLASGRIEGILDRFWNRTPRLYHHTLSLVETEAGLLGTGGLVVASVTCLFFLIQLYGEAMTLHIAVVLCVLWGSAAAGWFLEGQARRHPVPYILAQLCAVGFFAVIRRQLMLSGMWQIEYDVWASLMVSCAISGAKSFIQRQNPEVRLPAIGTLVVLPAIAMIWTVVHHLGTDMALVVVGLHSLLYAFVGKDDRRSPFNVGAICGFVAFIVILFWGKLELRAVNAYVIPVGLGILGLLHLAGDQVNRETAQRVRLVTLAAMLGSSGYYALTSEVFTLGFNLTLVVLCLAAMACGSFFRVKVYVIMGFGVLLVDLATIGYRVIAGLEGNYRMISIGVLLLLTGVAVVAASVHYKTYREQWEARLDAMRERLARWN